MLHTVLWEERQENDILHFFTKFTLREGSKKYEMVSLGWKTRTKIWGFYLNEIVFSNNKKTV